MKIRNGFVSNSSSSSFIIADIAKREDAFSDYPPMSSLTEYYEEWFRKNSYRSNFPNKKAKNVYQISLSSGKTYSTDEVVSVLKKYGYTAKCLDHYENDWMNYLNEYSCVVMDIRDCKHEDTPELIDMEWGKNYIWNKCKYCFEGGNVWNTHEEKTVQYTDNPFFRFIVESNEYKDFKEKVKTAKEESDKDWDNYHKEYEKFTKGEITEAPEFPDSDKPSERLSIMSIGDIMCRICHDHKANICFDVAKAVDMGCIYIYAEDNYLSWDCIEELKNNFQCILYAEHMG